MNQADGTPNELPVADSTLKASYVALKAATDSTKMIVSPFIEAPENEPGAKREFGGGNATLGGIPIVLGAEASQFKSYVRSQRQDVITALKSYMGEPNIGVYLVNEAGQIAGAADNVATPTKYTPFRIQSLFIGDKKLGGFEAPDENALEFGLPSNWSNNFAVITPADFVANSDI